MGGGVIGGQSSHRVGVVVVEDMASMKSSHNHRRQPLEDGCPSSARGTVWKGKNTKSRKRKGWSCACSSIGHSQTGAAISLQGPLHGHSQAHRHVPPLIGRLPVCSCGSSRLAPNALRHFVTCALFPHEDTHCRGQRTEKPAEPSSEILKRPHDNATTHGHRPKIASTP